MFLQPRCEGLSGWMILVFKGAEVTRGSAGQDLVSLTKGFSSWMGIVPGKASQSPPWSVT